MKCEDYQIYPSLKAVPEGVLENPWLVVEKFFPEYENGTYYVRIYKFFGDRGYCARFWFTASNREAEKHCQPRRHSHFGRSVAVRRRLEWIMGSWILSFTKGARLFLMSTGRRGF